LIAIAIASCRAIQQKSQSKKSDRRRKKRERARYQETGPLAATVISLFVVKAQAG